MNVLLITLSCLLAVTSCKEDDKKIVVRELKSVTYQPTEEIFPNPERGFYKYSLIEPGSGSGALSFTQVSNYRNSGISLVMRYFYLKNFKDKPLPSECFGISEIHHHTKSIPPFNNGRLCCLIPA